MSVGSNLGPRFNKLRSQMLYLVGQDFEVKVNKKTNI